MEEINIERKKKPIWPWILVLVIVGLLIWAIIDMTNDDAEVEIDETATGMLLPAGQQPLYFTAMTA